MGRNTTESFPRDIQYVKFSAYGVLKNLSFFTPFIILFFREAGLSFLQIGTLFSIREVAINLMEIPTGIIADSFGRKKAMVFSFTSYILSFLVFFFSSGFAFFAIAMVLFAAGEAFRSGTHKAMIVDYLKFHNLLHYKVAYYGHTRGWSQIGSALSALIAAFLVFYTGNYRIVFLASVLPYLIDLILIITYPRELDGMHRTMEQTGRILHRMRKNITTTLKGTAEVFRKKETLRALLNGSFFDGVFKATKEYLQPILKQYAILLPILTYLESKQRVALITGIVYLFVFLLTSVASRNSWKVSRLFSSIQRSLNITYLAGGLLIALSGLFLSFNLHIPVIGLFILFYMLENSKRPINVGYFSDLIQNEVMASGLSIESQFKTIFTALLAPLMGYIADSLGVNWGLLVMALLLFFIFPFSRLKSQITDIH